MVRILIDPSRIGKSDFIKQELIRNYDAYRCSNRESFIVEKDAKYSQVLDADYLRPLISAGISILTTVKNANIYIDCRSDVVQVMDEIVLLVQHVKRV